MTKEPEYTIYAGEEWFESSATQIEEADAWYHSFLVLVREGDTAPKIVQELHFEGRTGDAMQPVVYTGEREQEWFDERFFSALKSGTEEDILPYWNYGLKAAREFGRQGISFQDGYRHEETARNCRTAIKAVMRLMGIGLTHEFTKASAGTKADGFATEPVYYPEGQPKMPLSGLRRINQRLVTGLRDPKLDIPDHPFAKGM